jgi:hypothetical protein
MAGSPSSQPQSLVTVEQTAIAEDLIGESDEKSVRTGRRSRIAEKLDLHNEVFVLYDGGLPYAGHAGKHCYLRCGDIVSLHLCRLTAGRRLINKCIFVIAKICVAPPSIR